MAGASIAPKSRHYQVVAVFRQIGGASHVLSDPVATRLYRHGFRFGEGAALAVVRPGTLLEQWKIPEACIATRQRE